MANTMPASGVLKAAAIPAAPPASTTARRVSTASSRTARPIACMIAAPTWMVGPSRPIEAPPARPTSVSAILPAAVRSDSSRLIAMSSERRSAAITCGTPLPRASGKKRRHRNSESASDAGETASIAQGAVRRTACRQAATLSASEAKIRATSPTASAPSQ